jgi:hypothetical protein
MTSCATILNQPYKNVKVHTTEPSKIVHRNDTIKTVNNRANVWAERKKENLSIVAMTDSITKTIEIKSRNSFWWWFNIPYTYGIGMLVDMNNPKRYSYPKRIYINSADTISRYYRYSQSDNKGELHLHLSLPHFNFFHSVPENENALNNTSFWGATIGLDYYYSKNQFVNFGVSFAFGLIFPIPAAVDFTGDIELGSSQYISISNNHKIRRFSIGYGLCFARNTWFYNYIDRWDPPPPTRDLYPVTKTHYSFGLVFPAYFQLSENFNLGLVYRPTFYRPFLPNKFAYEHLISIDFAWKIRVKK